MATCDLEKTNFGIVFTSQTFVNFTFEKYLDSWRRAQCFTSSIVRNFQSIGSGSKSVGKSVKFVVCGTSNVLLYDHSTILIRSFERRDCSSDVVCQLNAMCVRVW
jgi:hypothetical protein